MSTNTTANSPPVNLAEAIAHPRGAVIVLLALLGILVLIFCTFCTMGCCLTAVNRYKTRNPARLSVEATAVEATYSEILTPPDADAENFDAVLIEVVSEAFQGQTSAAEALQLSSTATATATTAVQASPVSISVLSTPVSDGQPSQSRSRGFSLQLERTARTLSNLSSLVR
jgi:hypothetical protein